MRAVLPVLLSVFALAPTAAAERLAVLEFYNPAGLEQPVADYLTDRVRAAALKIVGERLKVLTRENLLALLPPDTDLADCAAGGCEVETGRRLGAGFVISGELVKVGESLKASIKLHSTADATLLGAEVASAPAADGLDAALAPAVERLLAPLARRAPTETGLPPLTALPDIPAIDAAGALAGTALGDVDTDLLDALQAALRLEQAGGAPREQAAAWQSVAARAKGELAEDAAERARKWTERAEAEEARARTLSEVLARYRADRTRLARLLAYDDAVASAEQKAQWQADFDRTYGPWMAEIERFGGAVDWVPLPGGAFEWAGLAEPVDVPPMAVARSEVTHGQYAACVDAGACAPVNWRRCVKGPELAGPLPDRFGAADQPVVCVRFEDAEAFARFVGGRLPTPTEWMYAARGGERRDGFPWGTAAPTCERAVFASDAGYGCGRRATWPVCDRPKGNSRHGLCDMAGNAAEWVRLGQAPSGEPRAFPGKRWGAAMGASVVHATPDPRIIEHLDPDRRFPYLGFRVVRDLR